MALDLDNLGPAPDINDLDLDKMDRGDSLVVDKVDEAPVDKEADEIIEDLTGKDEVAEDEVVEEEAEDKAAEEQPRDEKGKFAAKEAKIPKSRFDEAVGKEREAREAAERRAAELERRLNESAQQQVQSEQLQELETSVEALEKKHAEMLLDGNVEEAAKVMREIRMTERKIATAEAEARASQRTTQVLEAERMQLAIAQLEASHPALNPESENFDEDLVELVLAKQRTLIQTQGLSPSKALSMAAERVMERFGKPAEVESKEDPKGLSAKALEDRKQAQIKKNLETQKKQPASMKETGLDSDKAGQTGQLPDVSKMTQDEFSALPDTLKAKLRGDFV